MTSLQNNVRQLGTSAALSAVTLFGLAACGGGEDDYANTPRPPAPIVVTAAIGTKEVSISPTKFGAGPVSLIVTNLTDSPQEVTFESAGSTAGFTQRTSPINPRDTATLKADVPEGDAVLKVSTDGIRQANVAVGPRRGSAQNELLQP